MKFPRHPQSFIFLLIHKLPNPRAFQDMNNVSPPFSPLFLTRFQRLTSILTLLLCNIIPRHEQQLVSPVTLLLVVNATFLSSFLIKRPKGRQITFLLVCLIHCWCFTSTFILGATSGNLKPFTLSYEHWWWSGWLLPGRGESCHCTRWWVGQFGTDRENQVPHILLAEIVTVDIAGHYRGDPWLALATEQCQQ